MGRFPELTPVHQVQPNLIPGAGDITPRSEWTSSSTGSIRGQANGEVALDGEAAVLAVTGGLELSEASVSVSGPQADTAGVLKGLGEIGLSAQRVDSGIELAKLVFALAKTRDVSRKTPVPQFVGCLS